MPVKQIFVVLVIFVVFFIFSKAADLKTDSTHVTDPATKTVGTVYK